MTNLRQFREGERVFIKGLIVPGFDAEQEVACEVAAVGEYELDLFGLDPNTCPWGAVLMGVGFDVPGITVRRMPLATVDEYEHVLARVSELTSLDQRDTVEGAELESLRAIVEEYEHRTFMMDQDDFDFLAALPRPTGADLEASLDKAQELLLSTPEGRKALLENLARSLKRGAWQFKHVARARRILDVIEKEEGADVQGLRILVDGIKP